MLATVALRLVDRAPEVAFLVGDASRPSHLVSLLLKRESPCVGSEAETALLLEYLVLFRRRLVGLEKMRKLKAKAHTRHMAVTGWSFL